MHICLFYTIVQNQRKVLEKKKNDTICTDLYYTYSALYEKGITYKMLYGKI